MADMHLAVGVVQSPLSVVCLFPAKIGEFAVATHTKHWSRTMIKVSTAVVIIPVGWIVAHVVDHLIDGEIRYVAHVSP